MTVLDRFRLDGKRILVTGGSRGFGRAIALAAAEAGADVVLVARDPEALARTAAGGARTRTRSVDLSGGCRRSRGLRGSLPARAGGRGADRHPGQQCRRAQRRCADRDSRPCDVAPLDRPQPHPLLHLHQDDRRRDAGARARGGSSTSLRSAASSPTAELAGATMRRRRPRSSISPAPRPPTGRRGASP